MYKIYVLCCFQEFINIKIVKSLDLLRKTIVPISILGKIITPVQEPTQYVRER
jgi:hypothetical protein